MRTLTMVRSGIAESSFLEAGVLGGKDLRVTNLAGHQGFFNSMSLEQPDQFSELSEGDPAQGDPLACQGDGAGNFR